MNEHDEHDILDDAVEIQRVARETLIKQLKSDVGKVILGVILMFIFFFPWGGEEKLSEVWTNLHIVFYVAGFAVATALITHITRRILFPYVELKAYALKALETPSSAGMVFLGMSIIIAVTIFASAGFFK